MKSNQSSNSTKASEKQDRAGEPDRRGFMKQTAVGTTVIAGFHTSLAAASPSSTANQLKAAVMGVNGRGSALARGFARQKDVLVSHVCDVDSRAIGKRKSCR